MNLRQLECFRAVMSTGKMIRAAKMLNISQPAVSNLISGLEHEVGFTLFKRTQGRLEATAEAKHFYHEVIRSLESFQKTIDTAKEIRERKLGYLVIATYPGIAIDFLPRVVSEFLEHREHVRVKLLSRSSHVVRDIIPSQQFDLAIIEPPMDPGAALAEEFSFRCVCVLPESHPLADHEVLTPKLLDGEPLVSVYASHMTNQQLEKLFSEQGAKMNVVVEGQYFATCCTLASQGCGISIVDPFTADRFEKRGDVVVRPFEPAVIYRLDLAYPQEKVTPDLVDEFVFLFKKSISEYLY